MIVQMGLMLVQARVLLFVIKLEETLQADPRGLKMLPMEHERIKESPSAALEDQ